MESMENANESDVGVFKINSFDASMLFDIVLGELILSSLGTNASTIESKNKIEEMHRII